MCGIAGIFGTAADQFEVEEMLRKISHRGEKRYQAEMIQSLNFKMGTNRLAITDERSGKQPFSSSDGLVHCILNGEIYNHNELRRSLNHCYEFNGACDTEVILAGYLHLGQAVFELIQGMYSIALFDERTKDWFFARDHLGIKPLYYAIKGDNFIFSSELKSFYEITIDTIKELPCGALMKNGVLAKSNTYQFSCDIHHPIDEKQVIKEGFQQFKRAVIKMLPPQGDTAVCMLSGGVDSSSLLAMIKHVHKGPVLAYTFFNNDSSSDDFNAAKLLCDYLDIQLNVVTPSKKQLTDFYKEYGVWMTETYEPALVRNAVSYHFLSKKISDDGYKFALSGEGADELLGGYDYFQQFPNEEVDKQIENSLNQINNTYLKMADRASMFATLEVRVPYLDENWVSFNINLPSKYRIRGTDNKWLLRNLMADMLPDCIRNRAKMGMNQGAGFGTNDPGNSIYYQAIVKHYACSPSKKVDDLRLFSTYRNRYSIDESDVEELFNVCRYIEHKFDRLEGSICRPQLNTSKLIAS